MAIRIIIDWLFIKFFGTGWIRIFHRAYHAKYDTRNIWISIGFYCLYFFLLFLILPRVEYEFFTYRKHAKNEPSWISIFPPLLFISSMLLILPRAQYEFFRVLLKIDFFPSYLFFPVLFSILPRLEYENNFSHQIPQNANHRSIFFLSFIFFHYLDSAFEYKFSFEKNSLDARRMIIRLLSWN